MYVTPTDTHTYCIDGNGCSDYIWRFVVENEVHGFNVCNLLDKSFHTDNIHILIMTTTDTLSWCMLNAIVAYTVF